MASSSRSFKMAQRQRRSIELRTLFNRAIIYGTSETKLRLRRRRIRPSLLRQGQLKSAPRCPTVNPPTIGTKETYHAKTNSPLEHHHNRSVYCCDTVFRHS